MTAEFLTTVYPELGELLKTVLVNRFRVLLTPINLNVEKVQLITETCVLHNFLATENSQAYTEVEGELQQLPNIGRQSGNRNSDEVRHIRDVIKTFFNSPTFDTGLIFVLHCMREIRTSSKFLYTSRRP